MPPANTPAPRILYLEHQATMGGGQHQLLDLVRGIAARGEFLPIVMLDPRNLELAKQIRAVGIEVLELGPSMPPRRKDSGLWRKFFSLPAQATTFAHYLWRLDRAIRVTKPDIVYANTFLMAIAASLLKRLHGYKLIHSVMSSRAYAGHGPLDAFVLKRSDGALFNSRHTLDSYNALLTRSHLRTGINYSLVPDPRAQMLPAGQLRVRRDELRGTADFVIGFVGRIVPRKRVEDFVELAQKIKQRGRRVRFVVIGEGAMADPYYQRIRRQGEALGNDVFSFLGYRNNVIDDIGALDALVLPTEKESFGRVVVEAAYVGVPVIATRPGGPEEIISHLEGSYVVDLGDVAAMADAVETILDRNAKEAHHPAAIPQQFLNLFGEAPLISLESDFYRQVLSLPG